MPLGVCSVILTILVFTCLLFACSFLALCYFMSCDTATCCTDNSVVSCIVARYPSSRPACQTPFCIRDDAVIVTTMQVISAFIILSLFSLTST